jgi:putative SOS response-associated peptidase YedK
MCGRYASTRGRQELIDLFDIENDEAGEFEPDYNVAPTKPVPVVLSRDVRELHLARWGLVPSWAKDASGGAKMINARIETAHDKPAYRRAFAKRRCLVPADGYYEWETLENGAKQPHFIRPADGGVMAMAGLYEFWRPGRDTEDWLLTCTVITTQATEDVSGIHERMPVLVAPGRIEAWLDPSLTQPDEVRSLLAPLPTGRLEAHTVSTAVNKVRNNGPELLVPAPHPGASAGTLF